METAGILARTNGRIAFEAVVREGASATGATVALLKYRQACYGFPVRYLRGVALSDIVNNFLVAAIASASISCHIFPTTSRIRPFRFFKLYESLE